MRRERLAATGRLVLLVALVSFLFAAGKPALGSGTAGALTLPRCWPQGYGLEEALARADDAHQGVALTVGWVAAKERRRSCRLQTTIRLKITGSGLFPVEPQWNVSAVLRPWSSVEHTWIWQNWCPASAGDVTVEFSVPSGRTVQQLVASPPACVSPGSAPTVADLGTGTKYVQRPADRIPPHILPKGSPPPIPAGVIRVKNGWLVSDGYTLVAVYAGAAGTKPSAGRFAIVRQNLMFGVQYYPPDFVTIRNTGSLRITSAPSGTSRETTAQRGRITFVSANGTKGVLSLIGDRIRITAPG